MKISCKLFSTVLIISLGLLNFSGIANARLKSVSVNSEGVGTTKKAAILDAIQEALVQVNGAAVAASTMSQVSEASKSDKSGSKYDFENSFSQSVSTLTKGIIQKYDIISLGPDQSLNGLVVAKLNVVVSKYQASGQLKRLRLAVPSVYIKTSIISRRNREAANDIKTKLIDFLTQSRRFAILDREFTGETQKELNSLKSGDFKTEELARLGNKVGVDMIVLPTLNNFKIIKSKRTNKISGRVTVSYRAKSDLSVRIIDVATSQIKYSKNLKVDMRGRSREALAGLSAQKTSDLIVNAIFPPRIISLQGNLIVIGQGGDSFSKGRKFKLIEQGKRLFDPYTKESLGREERDAAVIEIVEATDRLSKAKIIKKILIDNLGVVLTRNFIIRPIFDSNPSKNSGINVKKVRKALEKRIEKLEKKSKDDW